MDRAFFRELLWRNWRIDLARETAQLRPELKSDAR
jgi:hypothetical protein